MEYYQINQTRFHNLQKKNFLPDKLGEYQVILNAGKKGFTLNISEDLHIIVKNINGKFSIRDNHQEEYTEEMLDTIELNDNEKSSNALVNKLNKLINDLGNITLKGDELLQAEELINSIQD